MTLVIVVCSVVFTACWLVFCIWNQLRWLAGVLWRQLRAWHGRPAGAVTLRVGHPPTREASGAQRETPKMSC